MVATNLVTPKGVAKHKRFFNKAAPDPSSSLLEALSICLFVRPSVSYRQNKLECFVFIFWLVPIFARKAIGYPNKATLKSIALSVGTLI